MTDKKIVLFLFQVHNWTVEQTTEWLEKNVELPQYMKTFIDHRVTGATLPRYFLNNTLSLIATPSPEISTRAVVE